MIEKVIFLYCLILYLFISLIVKPSIMSDYRIEKYQHGFEEEQAELSNEIAKHWIYPHQTSAEQIRESYLQGECDRESSLYCYKESNMVGFLISQVLIEESNIKRAKITFPLVLPGEEEAIDLLYIKSLELLKKKGIHSVYASLGNMWPNSEKWITKWSFKNKRNERAIYQLNVDQKNISENIANAREFNPKSDIEECVKMWTKDFNLSEEEINNFLLAINESKEIIAHIVLQEKGKIVAQGAVEKNKLDPKKGMLSAIHASENSYLKPLLEALSIISRKNGISNLYMFFTHLDIDSPKIKPYKAIGFTYVGSQATYEKKL